MIERNFSCDMGWHNRAMADTLIPSLRTALLVLLIAIVTSGCTPGISCDVYRLHRLPAPTGETVAIVAADSDLQTSLEFANYRALFEERLSNAGYTPVADTAEATLIAEIEYSVSEGAPRVMSSWPRCSYRYYYRSGEPFNPQWYGYRCWEPPTVSTIAQYVRELRMDIRPAGQPQSEPLFEGRATSIGLSNRMSEIMPYLVAAIFDNFPGESGQWKTIFIEEDALDEPDEVGASPASGSGCPATV
ncbi:uncharacterized protein DUF4136 [Parasphingopyxis lamellibrachiae]|uniref:Uncharacterized protein DUF4136 n=2 Tax=Parasphingopyxis lamellibrachiae TaxID=680125 RepID=A0A3D9FFT4_9SPHN|nr:uncharacterized protein DUF4136 [Parasphingopyxis lamellibrachiae]